MPVMRPVLASSFNPDGNDWAEKVIGRSPVAAIAKRKGFPGRTPKTFALLMRGAGEGRGVRMTAGSGRAAVGSNAGALVADSLVCAETLATINALAKAANRGANQKFGRETEKR